MNYVIKFCENNFVHGTDETARRLQEDDDYEVVITSCLGNCTDCADMPFAIVKDEIVYGNDPDNLYEEIIHVIN